MDSISGNDEHQARLAADIDELSGFIKEQQPGPEVGEVGKFVRGVEELAPQIAAGPAGMVNMLSTAAADKGLDALDQGVDPTTATMLAGKQAAETAAFMKIPQVGKTLPRSIAIGATSNPVLGTLGRAADVGILKSTGHQQQADTVNVIDPAAMAHEAAMGAMFSVDGHIRNNLARGRQLEEQQRTAAPEGREVELVPLDGSETPLARQPQPTVPVDPELASSLKWAAERLLDPATPAFDRQNLKRMLNDNNPQKLELVRSYRREQERQQKPSIPEGREVELIPWRKQTASQNCSSLLKTFFRIAPCQTMDRYPKHSRRRQGFCQTGSFLKQASRYLALWSKLQPVSVATRISMI